MATFEIKTQQGTFEVKAPSMEAALQALGMAQAPAQMSDPAPKGSAGFNAAMQEMSRMTREPAVAQYENLPEWQKPLVATNDIISNLVNGRTFGFADKMIAGVRAPFTEKTYDEELAGQRSKSLGSRKRAGWAGTIAELAGGVRTASDLAGRGFTGTRFAANTAPGLGRLGALSGGLAADGAALGAASALGNDTDVVAGAATGAVIGGLTPGAFALLRTTFAPIFNRLAPERATNAAIESMVARSGKTPQQIVDDLNNAAREGQDVFTVADSLGNPGQRMLSTIARTPNDGRRAVVEALENRQAGQGDRLANFVGRALNAPDTAAARGAAMTAERGAIADVNFGNARNSAGFVNPTGALQAADEVLMPGVNGMTNPGATIADDSLEGVLRRARGLVADERSVRVNFEGVLRAKQDIDDMIQAARQGGRNNQARVLTRMSRQLDTALERASPDYRVANDTFRQQSRAIDAIDEGRAATSPRTRASDNIGRFNQMRPAEQAGFRSGYSDPTIARIESAAPGVNKARPLMNDKTAAELQAFSVPSRRGRLNRQVGREQTMFETRNQALGGSKTADNLADQAEMATFDPTVWGNLLTGNIMGAGAAAGRNSLANLQGLSPQVRTRLAQFLLTRSPNRAGRRIANAIQQGRRLTGREIQTVRLLLTGGTLATLNTQRR